MAYNLDNFVGLVSTSDRVLKIYDSNNIIKYTINAFSINTLKVRNNIVVLSTRSKNIELDFSTSNEARLALSKLQNQLDILKEKTPLFVDKEISNFINAEGSGGTGPQGETGPQGPIGLGETGPQGFTGTQGETGPQGPIGLGETGPQGITGPQGERGIEGISSGRFFYFNESQTSDVVGYKVLSETPTSQSTQTVSISLTSNEQNRLVQQFITPELGFTLIPAGVQRFKLYLKTTGSAVDVATFVTLELYDQSEKGYGNFVTSSSVNIAYNDGQPIEVDVDVVFQQSTILSTDRMIVKIYLNNLDNTTRNVEWSTENGFYSYVITSVGVSVGAQGPSGPIGQTGTQGPTGPIENITINSVNVDYILSLSDSNKMVDVASSSTVTIGVPVHSSVPFEIGTQILLVRSGSGAVGVTSYPGVTLSSAQGYLNLNYQYSAATLVKKETDTWYIFGDLKA